MYVRSHLILSTWQNGEYESNRGRAKEDHRSIRSLVEATCKKSESLL